MKKNLIVTVVIGWGFSLASTVHAASSCAGVTIDTRGQHSPPLGSRSPIANSTLGHTEDFPLELTFLPDLATAKSGGVTRVVYEMKNIGSKSLQIPTQGEQGSMTSPNAKRPFDVFVLTLYASSSNGPNPLKAFYHQPTPPAPTSNTLPVLEGQAFLYGRTNSEQTVCSLPPGRTMRVIANVKIPTGASSTAQGHAELSRKRFDNTISSTAIGTTNSKLLRVGTSVMVETQQHSSEDAGITLTGSIIGEYTSHLRLSLTNTKNQAVSVATGMLTGSAPHPAAAFRFAIETAEHRRIQLFCTSDACSPGVVAGSIAPYVVHLAPGESFSFEIPLDAFRGVENDERLCTPGTRNSRLSASFTGTSGMFSGANSIETEHLWTGVLSTSVSIRCSQMVR